MDIGSDLRRARAWRNLTLDDIARRTRISLSVLRAIESNRFDQVPGGLFARGFLRSYAREVGLDPEPLVERYRAEFEPAELPDEAVPELKQKHEVPDETDFVPLDQAPRGPSQAIGFAVVVLIGIGYFGFLRNGTPGMQASGSSAPIEAAAVVTQPVAVGTSGTQAGAPAVDIPRDQPLTIEIETKSECWVAASADGERLVARLMAAGEKQKFDVRDVVMIRVGDPAAFAFRINGVNGRSLGPAGNPVNVQITRDNYKTFQQAI